MRNQFDILIIEDEPVIVNVTRKVLLREGFRIDEAFDAEDALKKLQINNYKLILTDLMLPRISGIDIIEKVQQTNPEIPIIIMTGYAMFENAMKCFKAGAFDFIPKPFDIDELSGVVYRAMRHAELMREIILHEKQFQPVNEGRLGGYGTGKYYYLGLHSWADIVQDGVTVLGLGETFPARMGEIQRVEFPALNTFIWQGNLCVKIIAHKHLVHSVWAPLSGKVVEINHELEKNPNLMNTEPYQNGWLIKIIPTNLESELENLILHGFEGANPKNYYKKTP